MPHLSSSSYPGPPFLQFNGHLQTIIPSFRKVDIPYKRERLELPDGDFLDLDWIKNGSPRLVLLSHGLEGNSRRSYIKGMARRFAEEGWDVLAWNCRSCSGEMNRNPRLYHHGDIEDIHQVILHALRVGNYRTITLIGFSMGGSILLKYLGVHGSKLLPEVKRGIAFSSPCNLKASARSLEKRENRFYRRRFLRSLEAKLRAKEQQFPGLIDVDKFEKIKMWRDFDEFFSAPLNGFASAEEFYHQASAENFMADIRVPVLLVNAWNDPILPAACTPVKLCARLPNIYLETPRRGGHVGFAVPGRGDNWMEERAWEFVSLER
ncbi:MAG: alpha/beta fold hydrolase [Saprospiraceae bacterium]|nr:alpha/beta fold hydrolase [Lewinella sp.]